MDTYVSALAVDPSCRKMGIAQMLMTSVENGHAAGDRVLSLQVGEPTQQPWPSHKAGLRGGGTRPRGDDALQGELVSNLFLGGAGGARSSCCKSCAQSHAASSGDEDKIWDGQLRALLRLVSRLVRSRNSRTITRQKQPAAVQ